MRLSLIVEVNSQAPEHEVTHKYQQIYILNFYNVFGAHYLIQSIDSRMYPRNVYRKMNRRERGEGTSQSQQQV
jgi:hypothetical protein